MPSLRPWASPAVRTACLRDSGSDQSASASFSRAVVSRAAGSPFIALSHEAWSSTGSLRNRKSTLAVISDRTPTRVWAYGAMRSQASVSKSSGAQLACGACSHGAQRSAKTFGSSRRMWSPLIDSAFFRSKRAGLAFTPSMSNLWTISSIEKTSWSLEKDQPRSER